MDFHTTRDIDLFLVTVAFRVDYRQRCLTRLNAQKNLEIVVFRELRSTDCCCPREMTNVGLNSVLNLKFLLKFHSLERIDRFQLIQFAIRGIDNPTDPLRSSSIE